MMKIGKDLFNNPRIARGILDNKKSIDYNNLCLFRDGGCSSVG